LNIKTIPISLRFEGSLNSIDKNVDIKFSAHHAFRKPNNLVFWKQ